MNSSKTLHFALNSIRNQTYPNIELIVVDNYSTDNTRAVAVRYGAKVYEVGPERADQINYGAKKAKGVYLFETGSDMISDPTYVEEAVQKCEEEGYDAIYSSVVSKEQKSYWGKVKSLERETYIGSNTIEAAHFVRRSVYLTLGGFDSRLISVEEDFQHRLDNAHYKSGRIEAREVHIKEADSLREVAYKAYYYGRYIKAYMAKHKRRGFAYLFPIRKEYLKHWRLFATRPALAVGFVIYKVVQYTAGIIGMLFATADQRKVRKVLYGASTTDKSTEKPA